MTAQAKNEAFQNRRMVRVRRGAAKGITVRAESIDESLEDARLNAIADERVSGPFVRVSLDDL